MHISTPGRICLFGEHQDYLHLPVIPAAISRRIHIDGERSSGKTVHLRLPDIGTEISFPVDQTLPYTAGREYFKSIINVLKRHGYTFSNGFNCTVQGNIPINAGTSSSSALNIAWVHFLMLCADRPQVTDMETLARYTFEAEVLEFGEPGGMMDHFSTAVGGVLFLKFFPSVNVLRLSPPFGTFVLGDSHEPKDTIGILSRVKNQVVRCTEELQKQFPDFSLQTVSVDDLPRYARSFNREQQELLRGTVRNRDITLAALHILSAPVLDERRFGELMNEHHSVLRDSLAISTGKIDRMIGSSIKAGALCGKINGSGGGGCMFAYAPRNPERVVEAIEREGGTAWIIRIDEGTRVEHSPVI